ncbi:Fic family protein [Frigoribacterium sp. PvP032]|uniref:Fic family protein n=1 Tax=Frigoribacterium sp. PvP032 TaxID=2806589 RepID=UPI001AE2EE23|nr:Fic family protein [Frigoribacterium sp. PvP032]MBP1189524.1 Fic family protein [Frigoribacterium sp. PvP032]
MAATPSSWPAISHETLEWTSRSASFGPRAARQGPLRASYQAAVPPRIADLSPVVSPEVATLADEASTALAVFDAELGSDVAPFASLLLRSEAAASSQIEQLTASARQILTAELGGGNRRNASAIVSNTRAMRRAVELSDELDAAAVLAMHEVLLEHDAQHDAGQFRKEAVWIGSRSDSPVGADFVGPRWERIPDLIDDVLAFARRLDVPRLIQVTVTHAQFETIHPFTDGNGRTGRALLQSMLRANELTRNVTVPVSAGLLGDTAGYYDALTAYRRGELDPITRLVAEASFEAVHNARELVAEISGIREGWRERLRARRDSGIWRALDVVARQPVLNPKVLAAEMGIEPKNAYPHLRRLAEAGILVSKTEHVGGQMFRSDEILAALDAFAARSGRRRRSA